MLKETVQSEKVPVAVPDKGLLLRCELIPWFMYREVKFFRTVYQPFLPLFHCLTPPAGNGVIVNRKVFIRYDQVFIYADYLPVAFADRTGSEW